MNPQDLPLLVTLAAFAVALPGLLRRRFGGWGARLSALAAMVAVVVLAVDPIGVAAVDGEAAVVERGVGQWEVADLLAAGPRADDLQLVWREEYDRGTGRRVSGRGSRMRAPPPLSFDPEAIAITVPGRLEVERPALLELRLPRSAAGVSLSWTAVDPTGIRVELFTGPVPDTGVVEASLAPGGEGVLELEWEFEDGDRRVRGTAQLDVGLAAEVVVLGPEREPLASALRLQGMRVRALPTLPADLGDVAAVVDTGAEVREPARLRDYVLDGGGLFLVGQGVPESGPLAALSPVDLLPEPEVVPDGGDGPGDGNTEPPVDPPDTPPDGVPPKDPDPKKSPGDTSDAKLDSSQEQEVERKTVSVVLLIDRSGSMTTRQGPLTIMDYARRAAWSTAQRLLPGDEVAVIGWGHENQVLRVLESTPATELPRIREAIEGLRAANWGTFVSPGLDEAARILRGSKAGVKHVILITDGLFNEPAVASVGAARRMHEQTKATLTIVRVAVGGLGPTFQSTSDAMTGNGKWGSYRLTEDPSRVPELVLTAVQRVTGRGKKPDGKDTEPQGTDDETPSPEDPKDPDPNDPETPPDESPEKLPDPTKTAAETEIDVFSVADGSRLLDPPRLDWPPVLGLRSAVQRVGSQTLLAAGDDGQPLLAWANRGLGRVGVWTADWFGPFGKRWVVDPEFPGRLAAWIGFVLPAPGGEPRAAVGVTWQAEPGAPLPREAEAWRAWTGQAVREAGTESGVRAESRTSVWPSWLGRTEWRPLWYWLAAALLLLAVAEWCTTRWGRVS